ncbi:MAG: PEGA domain-containing protein, partial [Terriglobales bacterium]
AAPVDAKAKLEIQSEPTGADIEVDGAFMGNTPSVLELPPGEHVVTVKKSGYKTWERKLKLTGGSVKLNPQLEANQ